MYQFVAARQVGIDLTIEYLLNEIKVRMECITKHIWIVKSHAQPIDR